MASRCCCLLSMESFLTFMSLYCSMSDSVDNLFSRLRIVNAWKPTMLLSSALSSMVLVALLTTSIACFDASSTESSSTSLYNQLIYFSFRTAVLTSTFTKLRHTSFEVVGLPLTIMYNSGSGKASSPLLVILT